MKNKKIVIIIFAIIFLLSIDQITKIIIINQNVDIIPNVITIQYEESLAGNLLGEKKGIITFITTNIIVLGVLIRFMKTQSEQIDKKTYIALIMIISGALGNIIDRIFRGFVIKFIKIANLPEFNIADMFIIIGWLLLAIFFAYFTYNFRKKQI